MKSLLIASTLATSVFAAEEFEERKAFNAFTHYICESQLAPRELLHHIQSETFNSKNYTFQYSHRDSYLCNIKSPNYPRYEPIGLPVIDCFSSIGSSNYIQIKWLLKDSPTPGINTNFSMRFSYEVTPEAAIIGVKETMINKEGDISLHDTFLSAILAEQQLDEEAEILLHDTAPIPAAGEQQLAIGPVSLNSDQIIRLKRYIYKAGYDGAYFNFSKFSKWYAIKFMGYQRGNIGFTSSNQPLVFNNYFTETFMRYLNVLDGHYAQLPFTKGICDQIESDTERLLREITSVLPKASLLPVTEARENLTFKEGLFYNQNNELATVTNKTYAVNIKGEIYISAAKSSHHPDLLRGKYGLCAGHISLEDGKISFISNNSGHYLPDAYHLYSYIESLSKEVFLSDCIVEYVLRGDNGQAVCNRTTLEQFMSFNKEELYSIWKNEIHRRVQENPFFQKITQSLSPL